MQSANCLQLSVLPAARGWMAQLEHRAAGLFANEDMALRLAVAEALALRAAGRAVRIAVRDRFGRLVGERCLCEGFNPPL